MKTTTTFTDAGWQFTPDAPVPVWSRYDNCNDGYPYICHFCFLAFICPEGCAPSGVDPNDYDDWAALNGTMVNNNNDWLLDMAYFTYYLHSVNETLAAWYQPIDLISGTTLPDRQGADHNGTITWGSLPAGVGVTLGSLTVEESPTVYIEPDDYTEVVHDVAVTDWFMEPDIGGTLSTHPLRPLITIMSDYTTITELQAWRFLGLALFLLVTVGSAVMLRGHLLIAGLASAGVIGLLAQQTVWPMWTLVFMIPCVIAGIMAERTPSIG